MDNPFNDHKLLLEHISGLMAIDNDGIVRYMNAQCADYINVNQEKSIGKHVKEVFPQTVMTDLLTGDTPFHTIFYYVEGRMSFSTQIQLRKDGEIIGVLEYDMIQDAKGLDDLLGKYTLFMRDEMDFYHEQMRNFKNTKYSINNILGSSKAVQDVKRQVELAAYSNSTVLITGETGTGKEVVAHSIHNLSTRAFGNFIKVNSAGMPASLIESELFGYEEGAFTGAKKGGKKGKFELADNGTLFIDEINQMPLNLQPKLLRVLQDGELDRVGSEEVIDINVRIIAATNQDLSKLVKQEKFREDLFYRLNVFPIIVPPLRERLEDLPQLIMPKVNELNFQFGKNVSKVDPAVYSFLEKHNWPGNVRELYNVVERAMNIVDKDILTVKDFDPNWINTSGNQPTATVVEDSGKNLIEKVKQNAERDLITNLLSHFGNNKTKVAKYLEIDRSLLYQKMRRLNIK